VKILFLGDICTDTYSDDDVIKFKKTKLYNFLINYDGYIIGNLESPILEDSVLDNKNKFSLLNKPSLFEMYDFCDAFTLANNHIFDQDINGYKKTVEFLEANNKKYFGAGVNLEDARKPLVLNIENKSIFILSYNCYSTNSEFDARVSSYGSSPLVYEYIEEDIKKAKKQKADYIFVLPHWGIENEFYPTYDQVGFAKRIIELGADGLIGSHTHTIQAFEVFNNKPIYYSLGNFLFNHFKISDTETYYQHKFNKEGLIVELDIDTSVQTNEIFIKFDTSMIPELIDIQNIETDVESINKIYREKIKNIKHNNMASNLSISLKYNGKNMQFVYDSNVLNQDVNIKYEKLKSKIKRVLMKKIKKLV
jgi:hypothetical protein